MSLREYLTKSGTVALQGIDTRALTRHLRVSGVMMGAISTELTRDELKSTLDSAPYYGNLNFVERVSTKETYEWTGDECSKLDDCPEAKCHVALIDLGIKRNIARCLAKEGCKVTILPCNASAEDVMAVNPDGVVFSPGPGDPRQLKDTVRCMQNLVGKKPILGICLGHQMFGMAMGGNIIKLKFGHRGANHPVKNLITGKVGITAQNHGYAVHPDGLSDDAEVTRVNLNDGSVEGLRHKHLPIFSIQYHPEASAGPMDEGYLFDEFVQNVVGAM
jgi:carbamoyl-phosphate synthase small subunit